MDLKLHWLKSLWNTQRLIQFVIYYPALIKLGKLKSSMKHMHIKFIYYAVKYCPGATTNSKGNKVLYISGFAKHTNLPIPCTFLEWRST